MKKKTISLYEARLLLKCEIPISGGELMWCCPCCQMVHGINQECKEPEVLP